MIRKVILSDAAQIAKIYNYYVRETAITFEIEEVTAEQVEQRIEKTLNDNHPYYVYEENNQILGYCYLSSWKARSAYNKSAELSIYLDVEMKFRGIGSKLMEHIHKHINKEQYHTILACITLPNDTSVRLHQKFGYTQVSHYKEVGFKFNKWIDVGDWQLIL